MQKKEGELTMRLHSIRIEGRDEIAWPPQNLLQTLIHSLSTQNGPTFVALTGPNDQYVQAAGSAGRSILESRDTYGEGFQHLRASLPQKQGDRRPANRTLSKKSDSPPSQGGGTGMW